MPFQGGRDTPLEGLRPNRQTSVEASQIIWSPYLCGEQLSEVMVKVCFIEISFEYEAIEYGPVGRAYADVRPGGC